MEQHTCETCRRYCAHFAIVDSSLRRINDGHCINEEMNALNKQNSRRLHKNCDKWEPIALQKQEKHALICDTLKRMERHLADIAQILKYYEEQ